jgi:hypothetical protein
VISFDSYQAQQLMEYIQLQTVRAGGDQFDSYFGHVALKGKQISQEVYNIMWVKQS